MSIESINFNIECENNRHKKVINDLKQRIEQENIRHKQAIASLKQQKANVLENEKKYVTEDYTLTPVGRLNRQFELVYNELEAIN